MSEEKGGLDGGQGGEVRSNRGLLPVWFRVLRGKRIWHVLFLIFLITAIYLFFVFMVAYSKSKGYPASSRPGETLPEMSNDISQECTAVFRATTLTPLVQGDHFHSNQVDPEFREYASVWLLDSARTSMYQAALLDHPACLNFMIKRMSVNKNRRILVIYDRNKNAEILIIRNYH